jgi:predicted DCC family thiol-disulfide oxidoreductase YuxK
MNIAYPLTIYYDAACPMCKTEMETLKESDLESKLILVDCSNPNMQAPASCPVTRKAMMERIQAQDAIGRWINGVEVFQAAYAAAGFDRLSKLFGNATLRPLLSRLYPWVADNRHWLSKTPTPYLLNRTLRFFANRNTSRMGG